MVAADPHPSGGLQLPHRAEGRGLPPPRLQREHPSAVGEVGANKTGVVHVLFSVFLFALLFGGKATAHVVSVLFLGVLSLCV